MVDATEDTDMNAQPVEITVNRHNHLIDPHLDVWGWEIAGYLFLGGLVAGLMVFGAALLRKQGEAAPRALRWSPFLAPVLLSLGMFFLFLDLENKENVLRFYLALRPTSPMSWGAWILVLIYPATIALGLAGLTEAESERLASLRVMQRTRLATALRWVRRAVAPHRERLLGASVALGVALGLYTGILLGTLQARPLWSSAVLGPLFLVSGLSTGAALLMLLPVRHSDHESLRRWDVWLIGSELALLAFFLLDQAGGGARGGAQLARFMGGDLTAVFWTFVVFAGLVVPASLELLEKRRRLLPTVAAPLLILAGGFVLRWVMVFGGQAAVAG